MRNFTGNIQGHPVAQNGLIEDHIGQHILNHLSEMALSLDSSGMVVFRDTIKIDYKIATSSKPRTKVENKFNVIDFQE